jgi:hypothetical protein
MRRFFLPLALFAALVASLAPQEALAYTLPAGWAVGICGIIPCTGGGGGAFGLSVYVFSRIIFAIQVGFLGIAFVMFFTYAATLVLGSHDQTYVSEAKTAYAHLITGGAIVSLAHLIVLAVSPVEVGDVVVNPYPIVGGITNAIFYFRIILATALTVNLVIQATRLIIAQGAEETEKVKRRLIHGFVGVAIVLLANSLVVAVDPSVGTPSSVIAIEFRGIANFLLAALGVLVVIALLAAGILLVISIDEQLKEKAKMVVKTTIIALTVVLAAYALVNAFITLPG